MSNTAYHQVQIALRSDVEGEAPAQLHLTMYVTGRTDAADAVAAQFGDKAAIVRIRKATAAEIADIHAAVLPVL